MKKLVIFTIVVSFLIFFTKSVSAKVLPQAQKGRGTSLVKSSYGTGINVSPKIRDDKKALLVFFSNLQNATSISYSLTYIANGQQEGAVGSVSPSDGNTSRELLFGTCSKNVCRYHTNISNAKLEVSYTSTNGKKYLKRYRIKV